MSRSKKKSNGHVEGTAREYQDTAMITKVKLHCIYNCNVLHHSFKVTSKEKIIYHICVYVCMLSFFMLYIANFCQSYRSISDL